MKGVYYKNQCLHLFLITARLSAKATISFSTGDSELYFFIFKRYHFLLTCYIVLSLSFVLAPFNQYLHFMFSLSPYRNNLYSLVVQRTFGVGASFSFRALCICLGFFSILEYKIYACLLTCYRVLVLSLVAISG